MADTLVLYRDGADSGLDLSAYVDVANGGINPGDADVRQPVWAGAPGGYGSPLIAERLGNREFTVQVLFSASTRDGLLGLFRQVKERLDGDDPHVSWTPEGASSATTFRIRYGRLLGSDRYDYAREVRLYARRLLALSCAPWGEGSRRRGSDLTVHAPTLHGFASSVSPSNPAAFPMPSVGGDAPAAVRWAFGHGSHASSQTPQYAGFAFGLTWQPSFLPAWLSGGASMIRAWDGTTYGPTAYVADAFAPGGGQAVQLSGTYRASGQTLPFARVVSYHRGSLASYMHAAPWPGRYRMFLSARTRSTHIGFVTLQARDAYGNVGPVATPAHVPSAWQWLDLGDVMVKPDQTDLYVGVRYATGATFAQTLASNLVASPVVNISAVALVPKDVGYGQIRHTGQENLASMWWVVDGIEADRQLRAGGPLPIASVAAQPVAQSSGWNYDLGFVGDRPQAPYTPSGVATGPVAVVLGIRSNPTAHRATDRVGVVLMQLDRYVFAK